MSSDAPSASSQGGTGIVLAYDPVYGWPTIINDDNHVGGAIADGFPVGFWSITQFFNTIISL